MRPPATPGEIVTFDSGSFLMRMILIWFLWTRLVELLPNKILKKNFQGYGITTFPSGYVDESTVITVDSPWHTSVETSYVGPDQESSYKNKVFLKQYSRIVKLKFVIIRIFHLTEKYI